MAISGNQLAQILRSFGVSPKDITAVAAELSRSVVCTRVPILASKFTTSIRQAPANVASAEPPVPSSQVITPAIPCDPGPNPTQASSTASQPLIATPVAPSPTHSTAPLCSTPTTTTAPSFPTLSITTALQPTEASAPSPTTVVPCIPGVSVAASGAAEYFQINSGAPPMQPVPSSAMHGLQQLALSSAANGARVGSGTPSASSTSPWDIPAPWALQWGASGTSTSVDPHAAALPQAMGSALVTASMGSSPAAQAFSWITSSTPIPKATRRKPSSAAPKPSSRKAVARKTIYLIPRAGALQLTPKIKAACDFAGLIASPELWSDMSSAEVREALQEPFTAVCNLVGTNKILRNFDGLFSWTCAMHNLLNSPPIHLRLGTHNQRLQMQMQELDLRV